MFCIYFFEIAGGAGFLALGPFAAAGAAVVAAGAGIAYVSRGGAKSMKKGNDQNMSNLQKTFFIKRKCSKN